MEDSIANTIMTFFYIVASCLVIGMGIMLLWQKRSRERYNAHLMFAFWSAVVAIFCFNVTLFDMMNIWL